MSSEEPRRLGVVGGVGPAATARLYEAVVASVRARADQQRHPDIVIHNLPFEAARERAFVEGWFTEGDVDHFVEALALSLTVLMEAGATCIALPCNTLHALLPAVFERVPESRAITVDLPRATMAAVPEVSRVLVLGTTATTRLGLYEPLRDRGMQLDFPAEDARPELERAILDGIEGRADMADRRLAAVVAQAQPRPDAVIVACTDLDLAAGSRLASVPVVRSLGVLVERCVAHLLTPVMATGLRRAR